MTVMSTIKSELKIYRCEKCQREETFTLSNLDNPMTWFHRGLGSDGICDGLLNLVEIWTDREKWEEIILKECYNK